jgi:hypothetical protein
MHFIGPVVSRYLGRDRVEAAMSPTGHKDRGDCPRSADPLETVVKGEQVLEKAKSVSRQIVDACRRVAPDDTNLDGPTLQQSLSPPPEHT